MKIYSFEKLIVWQKAKDLYVTVTKLSGNFPKEELFGITSQIRRSSGSIAANIAEGSGRKSPRDKARFSEIAYSSALETLNHTIACYELNYLTETEYKSVRAMLEEITLMLDALHKTQLNTLTL